MLTIEPSQLIEDARELSIGWLGGPDRTRPRFGSEDINEPGLLVIEGHRNQTPSRTYETETTDSLLQRWSALRNTVPRSASEMLSVTYALHLHCL